MPSTPNSPGNSCRKLCSSAAIFQPPQLLHRSERLFGVMLLNSPTNSQWEYAQYLRLWSWYRSVETRSVTSRRSSPCLFLCADGAYQGLLRYCSSVDRSSAGNAEGALSAPSASVAPSSHYCDAIIGDMDSFDEGRRRYHTAPGNHATPTAGESTANSVRPMVQDNGVVYDSVRTISDEVLSELWARSRDDDHQRTPRRPLLLPVSCQLTTDFQKAMGLLGRLRDRCLEDVEGDAASSVGGVDLVTRCGNLTDALCADECLTPYSEDPREKVRVVSLLSGVQRDYSGCCVANRCPSGVRHTHVLPGVAVLGGLGGRFDHEMATVSCILEYSREFHVMVTNAYNVMFACYPGGVTSWLPTCCALGEHSHPLRRVCTATKAPSAEAVQDHEGAICGYIPYGRVEALETSGLLYNMVNGKEFEGTYDGVTRTEQYAFGFSELISSSNEAVDAVVTIDLRTAPGRPSNPPCLLTSSREACPTHDVTLA